MLLDKEGWDPIASTEAAAVAVLVVQLNGTESGLNGRKPFVIVLKGRN